MVAVVADVVVVGGVVGVVVAVAGVVHVHVGVYVGVGIVASKLFSILPTIVGHKIFVDFHFCFGGFEF